MALAPLIIVSGPAGSGKSTIIRRLLDDKTWPMRLSVSVTTRAPRRNEEPGVHYYYWSVPDFVKARDAGEFLEWAEVHGNYYGTLASEVVPHRARGVGVLLDIDVQGGEQVRRSCADAVSIFILPPSFEVLEQRLRGRRTETEEAIQRRLKNALTELNRAGEYQYQVINDDLETTLASVRTILRPLFERSKHAG
jgi:guanylate kinase